MARQRRRQILRGDAATRISRTPPSSSWTSIRAAPASRLFSSNSLSTDAGRSTTSPAAIWLISSSGSGLMIPILARRDRGKAADGTWRCALFDPSPFHFSLPGPGCADYSFR
jgi:hypothetical protein